MITDPITIGQNLYRARTLRDKSMDQLVEDTGNRVSKATIAKIEAGLVMPREKTLKLLEEALELRPDYLYKPIMVNAKVSGMIRSRSELSERQTNLIAEGVNQQMQDYRQLEMMLLEYKDFQPAFDLMPVCNEQESEDAADIWRSSWRLGEGPLPGITALLEERHLRICELNLVPELDGLTASLGPGEPVIVLNSTINAERKRFTMLSQLAGLLLHFPESMKSSDRERMCMRFAGAALIPEKALVQLIGKKRESLYLSEVIDLRNGWGISLGAVMRRMLELKIIGQPIYTQFKNTLQDNPLENGLGAYPGIEKPLRFHRLVLQALSRNIITRSLAAELLQCRQSDLQHEILFTHSQPITN